MSIFIQANEEYIKSDFSRNNYYQKIENLLDIKKINFNEDLEMLLYDIEDAIVNRQILMIETDKDNTDGYLIPLIYAYKCSKNFNHLIISTSSNEQIDIIYQKVKNLLTKLDIDMPIHCLKSEENYLCLRRLRKSIKKRNNDIYNVIRIDFERDKKRYQREDWLDINDDIWSKVHVNHCSNSLCSFFHNCHYALQQHEISQGGLVIMNHGDLVGNNRYESLNNIAEKSNFVLIDDANEFVQNVKNKYKNNINLEVIYRYLFTASRNLSKYHLYMIEDEDIKTIDNFFTICLNQFKQGQFLITKELRDLSYTIASLFKNISFQLSRLAIPSHKPANYIEDIYDTIEVFADFFKDISNNGIKYHYFYEIKDCENDNELSQFKITYYPNKVDKIINEALNKINCSIVFTGDNIAGEDNEYQLLSSTCDINQVNKELVKEFSIQTKI